MGGLKRNEWGMNGGVSDGKQWDEWALWVWKDEKKQWDGCLDTGSEHDDSGQGGWVQGLREKKSGHCTFSLRVSISYRWPFDIVFTNLTLLDHHLLHLSSLESILITTTNLNMMPHAPKNGIKRD